MMQQLRCFFYRIYDWSKSTWLISHLFYGGKKYTHYEDISVTGIVSSVNSNAADGDFTFDIDTTTYGHLHCEITPCYQIAQALWNRLCAGAEVSVCGTHTFDPAHLGDQDKWEIHPVKTLEVHGIPK